MAFFIPGTQLLSSDSIFAIAVEVDVPRPPICKEITILTRDSNQKSWDLNPVLCEASVRILATAPSLIIVVEGKDDIIDRALCKTKVLYTVTLLSHYKKCLLTCKMGLEVAFLSTSQGGRGTLT